MKTLDEQKKEILELTKAYYAASFRCPGPFQEGDRINYAGRVFDEKEMCNLVEAALEFWLTSGKWTQKFEQMLSGYLEVSYCSFVNSGSSANLLAFMALTSPQLGQRRIQKGDEIITVAACFPTTVAPILQYGAVPVFLDISIPQYNIRTEDLEKALSDKTKAVMLAHTMGNPFNLNEVKGFCDKHGLWLVEDNCDALGSRYSCGGEWKYTGTIGDVGTSSFYPPHHITTGEGGAVYTDNPLLHRIINSFRDWGRDCWCSPGQDGSCGCRYGQQFGELPKGFDHKYVYSHLGYNLKATDLQAAVGCAQLEKLGEFTERRKRNFTYLKKLLEPYRQELILPEPAEHADPSWFGFLLTVKEDAGFTRDGMVQYLERHNIQTRNLFAGNIIRHPCFDSFRGDMGRYRQVGALEQTDRVMSGTFWVGVYPEMPEEKLKYMAKIIGEFIMEKRAEKKR